MNIKKTISFFFLMLLFFLFTNNFVLAAESRTNCPVPYSEGGGLVPCGNTTTCPCTLCDLFVLMNNIVDLLLFKIVPILAAILLAVGGIMMIWSYSGGGGTENLSKAKSLFTSVVIGLLIIYCAWLIVNLFLWAMGVTDATGGWKDGPGSWWTVKCAAAPSSNALVSNSDSLTRIHGLVQYNYS